MVKTRIAPSPTGENLHIGNVYTALINFVFAKKNNGKFIVRIEDTDQTRLVEGSEKRILDSLSWLGLAPDETPIRQSERLDIYNKYANELVSKGHAYYCNCSLDRLKEVREEQQKKKIPPRYDGHCRELKLTSGVVRLKVPRGKTTFHDVIRGEISIENNILDDQVLLKSDGFPTYHLAVVVDDHLMEISHIIRAEEWISSTPKHILLYQFFGWELPQFAHLPILRNPDKSKLSKRKNPVWVSWYREKGFLPEAILNYLALMGWSMPDEREIFSMSEYIDKFSLERVQTTGPVFDMTKLEWMNGEYIRKTEMSKIKDQILSYLIEYVSESKETINESLVGNTIPLIQTRIKTMSEYWPMCEFFFKKPDKLEKDVNAEWIKKVVERIESLTDWTHDAMYSEFSKLSNELDVSKSKLFMDIRVAITGKKIGPPLFESMEILGKEESVNRLNLMSK